MNTELRDALEERDRYKSEVKTLAASLTSDKTPRVWSLDGEPLTLVQKIIGLWVFATSIAATGIVWYLFGWIYAAATIIGLGAMACAWAIQYKLAAYTPPETEAFIPEQDVRTIAWACDAIAEDGTVLTVKKERCDYDDGHDRSSSYKCFRCEGTGFKYSIAASKVAT